MGILDGFWFWIGKALAELVVAVGVLALFGIILGLILWSQERDAKKRRDAAGDESSTKEKS